MSYEIRATKVCSNLLNVGLAMYMGGDYRLLLRRYRNNERKGSVTYKIYDGLVNATRKEVDLRIQQVADLVVGP